jgi:hypothetical protein
MAAAPALKMRDVMFLSTMVATAASSPRDWTSR